MTKRETLMSTKPTAAQTAPGPRPMPIVGWRGNALHFYLDPIAYMNRLKATYQGDVIAFVQGGNRSLLYTERQSPGTVFIFGPQYNHLILSDTTTFQSREANGPDTDAFHRLMENSVVFVNGDTHKQFRRLMLPAFHKKRVETYRDTMVALTQALLDDWAKTGVEQRDILEDMQRLTLIIANKVLFGMDISGKADSLGEIIQEWFKLLVSPAAILRVDVPGMPFHRLRVLSEQVDETLTKLVAQRKSTGEDLGDVLSMLIQARDEDGNALSNEEIIGNANTLFIAGHETTANALSWTLYLLAQHPQVMRDLYDELHGVLGGAAPTVEQIDSLKLLDAVIKESMRLLPPGALSIRIAAEPVELGEYTLPQWTEIIFSRYHVHHSPAIYPEPEHFKPERWFSIAPTAYEYLPFGAGARMCIGAPFATLEMKIVLAMLLQKHRFQFVAGSRVGRNVGFTMSPKPGMPMVVHPQDKAFERSPGEAHGVITEMVHVPSGK